MGRHEIRIAEAAFLSASAVMGYCQDVMGRHPRLFDGWPSGRLYNRESDETRVARIRAASIALTARTAISDETVFECCSLLAARRRSARYGRYAAQVERAMSTS